MSGRSRRKGRHRRRPSDGLAEYRERSKDPLYADYCKQVIALVKRGRQRDLPDEFLADCSPAVIPHGHAGAVRLPVRLMARWLPGVRLESSIAAPPRRASW